MIFIAFLFMQPNTVKYFTMKLWGGELDSGLRPKGPEGHALRNGPGPKMWMGARTTEE